MEIYEYDDYPVFIRALKRVWKENNYSMEWYNSAIDHIATLPYKDAVFLVDLLNDFYYYNPHLDGEERYIPF